MKENFMVNPLVSIIINCLNGERYLRECLDSIINQSYINWEIIFWDNGSSDRSSKIFKSYNDKRFNYFYSNDNDTLYEARNKAISKAKGKYISFLDVDDTWSNDKLMQQVKFLENNKNYQIVYSNYYILNELKKKKNICFKYSLPSGDITSKLLKNYSIGILTVLALKEVFMKDKFDKKYNIIGDFDFFINASRLYKIGALQSPLAYYRVHSSNYSTTHISKHVEELNFWLIKNKEIFKNFKHSLNYLRLEILFSN